MANNYNESNGMGNYYDPDNQPYYNEAGDYPYYEGAGGPSNRFNRGTRGSRGYNNSGDNNFRGGQRGGRGGQRPFRPNRGGGGRGQGGSFGPRDNRGSRRSRGSFDPLPSHVVWPQQLEKDRKEASVNWAPTFRAAGIPIPTQFFSRTRDEQAVLGQELMDIADISQASAQTGHFQNLAPTTDQPLDMAALDMEANDVTGD